MVRKSSIVGIIAAVMSYEASAQSAMDCINRQVTCSSSCTTNSCYQRCADAAMQCSMNNLSERGVDTSTWEDTYNRSYSDGYRSGGTGQTTRSKHEAAQHCASVKPTEYGGTLWKNSCSKKIIVSWYDQGSCRDTGSGSGFGCSVTVGAYGEELAPSVEGRYKYAACEYPGFPRLDSNGKFQCR